MEQAAMKDDWKELQKLIDRMKSLLEDLRLNNIAIDRLTTRWLNERPQNTIADGGRSEWQ